MRSSLFKTGSVEGTGATLKVPVGFVPKYVKLLNIDDAGAYYPSIEWWYGMGAATGLKTNSGSYVLASAGLAIGSGSKAKVKIVNTVNFVIAGVYYSKTTAEVAFTATTHDIAANASYVQEACYLLSLNAAGTCTITMGAIATGSGNAVVPACPALNVAIGYVRIAIAAGATPFDASTDELDAAHITDTYVNFYAVGTPITLLGSLGITQYAGEAPMTKLAGTVSMSAASATITGSGTAFLTDLKVGDEVIIEGVTYTIATVASDTSATTTVAAAAAVAAKQIIRKTGRQPGFIIGADADMNVSGETIVYLCVA